MIPNLPVRYDNAMANDGRPASTRAVALRGDGRWSQPSGARRDRRDRSRHSPMRMASD